MCKALAETYAGVEAFCEAKGLTLNAQKTQLIFFKQPSRKIPDCSIIINNQRLEPVREVKLLGVTLACHLTMSRHIDKVVSKCHGLLGMLAKAANMLDQKLLKLTYIALIRSHLEYASAIVAMAAPSHLKKLDIIQKMASRIITSSPRDAHSEPLLKSLALDPLGARRLAHITDIAKACQAGAVHPGLLDMLSPNTPMALVPTTRTTVGRKSSFFLGTLALGNPTCSAHLS